MVVLKPMILGCLGGVPDQQLLDLHQLGTEAVWGPCFKIPGVTGHVGADPGVDWQVTKSCMTTVTMLQRMKSAISKH